MLFVNRYKTYYVNFNFKWLCPTLLLHASCREASLEALLPIPKDKGFIKE